MVYYILLNTDPPDALFYDNAILGETTHFGKSFYANRGFHRLTKIVNECPELLDKITILDDSSKKYTLEQFLKLLNNYNILIKKE